jgi:hypothetical protein
MCILIALFLKKCAYKLIARRVPSGANALSEEAIF